MNIGCLKVSFVKKFELDCRQRSASWIARHLWRRWCFLRAGVLVCFASSLIGPLRAQPILIESRTSTNTDNSLLWSYPSGVWGTSGNLSKAACTPAFEAAGSRQTTSTSGPPSFRVVPTNGSALQLGVVYALQVTTPGSSTQPPPNDLVVAISLTGVTNSTLPATTTAFSTDGTDKWTTLGEIICSNNNPTFTFTYASGSIGVSPDRRFYAQCVRFIPQNQTNAARTWTGGAGVTDPMWNNPTNWGGTPPRLSGDDIMFASSTNLYSVPDGPFIVNSLKFLSGAGPFTLGTNFSGPIAITSTNGVENLSSNDQTICAPINQGSVPLKVQTGGRMLLISNTFSGTGGYTVSGSGSLNLRSTNNNITGSIIVNTGATLRLMKHSCVGSTDIGAGDVILAGGTLRNDDTTAGGWFLTVNRRIIVGPGGATLTLLVSSSQNLIYDGVISNHSGGGPLTKEGSGRLTLAGTEPNTYTSSTTVNAGRLILNKSSSNAVPGNLAVPAGMVQLLANHQIGDGATVIVSGGLLALSPGVSDAVGQVILDGGSITGAVSTLTATNFDFRIGTNTANLAGTGKLTKTGSGTVLLNGNNSYSGATLVSEGRLVVNGTISAGSVVVTGGELAGTGTIASHVEIETGGKLSPGQSIGQLTITSSLELESGSITFIELNKAAGTNDFIAGLTNINCGGTLIVTNLAGTLTTNDTFKLFEATTYSDSFDAFALPPLSAGLTWSTANLAVDGTIKVIEIAAPPQQPSITSAILIGTNLVVSGAGGTTNGTFYVLACSNAAVPVTNWTAIATGQFGGSGQFTFTNPVTPQFPQRYFILQLP